jgi:hypothetical protein
MKIKLSILFLFFAIALQAEIPTSIRSWYNEKTELSHQKFLNKYSKYIEQTCDRHNISNMIYIVKSIPPRESKCKRYAKSPEGAKGFYQVMGGSYEPFKNIEKGISRFSDYLQINNGDVEKALMSYNDGPGGMRTAIKAYNNYISGKPYNHKKLKVYFKIKRYAKDVMTLASHLYAKENDNYSSLYSNNFDLKNWKYCIHSISPT